MNLDLVTNYHRLYHRYKDDWKLQLNSFLGGTEYRHGKYLRAYSSDTTSPGESINTYDIGPDGAVTSKHRAKLEIGNSSDTESLDDGSFYGEKLNNTPLLNYVRLIVSEYNAILFRNPPQRELPTDEVIMEFISDVDGEGNNISEFMSLLDQYTTIFGVCHLGAYLYDGKPRWRIHTPLDITNWEYSYNRNGELTLDSIVIKLNNSDDYTVYRYMTPEAIHTVWVRDDESDWEPEDLSSVTEWDDGVWAVSQPNELGYVPIVTTYQNLKVYDGVGATVISDCAGIQRSIHGDLAEIYTAITYGAHPVTLIDESTDQLNNGEIGAEPGSIIRVPASLTGDQNYTYEFVAPPLDAISQIQDLVDNKVGKLAQIAMLRSEDLVRAANSGEQIEQYDDKLAALIRRKATNMENTEYRAWQIVLDWLNISANINISYNRQYNKRALEHEIREIQMLLELVDTSVTDELERGEIRSSLTQRIRDLVNSTSTQNGV